MADIDLGNGWVELAGRNDADMRALIRLYMDRGVPEGMTFFADFEKSEENVFAIRIKRTTECGRLWTQYMYVFGWRPRVNLDCMSAAKSLRMAWRTMVATNDASYLLSDPDFTYNRKECFELAERLEETDRAIDEAVLGIFNTLGDPHNWIDPPPKSAVFVVSPFSLEGMI